VLYFAGIYPVDVEQGTRPSVPPQADCEVMKAFYYI